MIRNERKSTLSNSQGTCVLVGEELTGERKSTLSNPSGSCVMVGQARKSSLSHQNGGCVVAGHDGDMITMRDSKLGTDSPVLRFTRAEWEAFTGGVRLGEFDLDEAGNLVPVPMEGVK